MARGPGLDPRQAEQRVILQAFFKRGLLVLPRKMAEFRKVWKLITTAPEPLVIVQGDLPRVFYLMLQLRAPLLFIRQDGILSCPGNNRFLRRSRSVCRARFGVSCLSVHRKEECLGGLSLIQQLGRMATRTRDRLLLSCIRNFVGSSRYIARVHGRPQRVLYPPRLGGAGKLIAIGRNRHRLAFCGRLEEVKGAGDAVGILSLLPDQYHLEILGDGPERGRLGKLVEDLQLGSRVRFLGWVDRVTRDQVLASAGVLLMPSLWDEAFGMAGIEALAQGTPVVAYDVGGISEWCQDGAGVLVACGDIRRAAAAVRGLTDDPIRWAGCSEAAKRASVLRFPTSRFGSDLEELLREVLGTSSEPEELKI
jgi:glycosyltransferase involved in cell wall biosynthesis